MDHYAVIGNPIGHSKSPQIHAAFARQTGQHLEYGRILGRLDDFAADVRGFVAEGGRGLNVTIPFKEQAFEMLADRSDRAAAAGALNSIIVLDDGRLRGDNTDGVGLVRDLATNHGFGFQGKRILLLGAGGAARGVVRPLLDTGLAGLIIANRTPQKALELAVRAGAPARGCGLDGLGAHCAEHGAFDLVINATSAGLGDQVPPVPAACLAEGAWIYDMLYGDTPTGFCRWGQQQGAGYVLDGLGMLVEQAAESFLLWRGVRPETAPVIAMLRGR